MPPDPFTALGLEPRFDLARDHIEASYLARVASQHPDAASTEHAGHARAADLNDARAVLLDPERRAGALLARLGGPAPEKDKSLPPAFLAEMMEIRENLEDARQGTDPAMLDHSREWSRQRRAAMIQEVAGLFASLPPSPAPAALGAVRRTLNAWRYIERMIEQMEEQSR